MFRAEDFKVTRKQSKERNHCLRLMASNKEVEELEKLTKRLGYKHMSDTMREGLRLLKEVADEQGY